MSKEYEFAGSRFLGKEVNQKKATLNDSSFVVASVEAGNTTTKCILTVTDLKTGTTEVIGKHVRLTREIQKPSQLSAVFGKTLSGTELTKETLSELVKETIEQTLNEKGLTTEDVHFVVRSTGVTVETGEQLQMIILALADGCLKAGFPPRKMTGYLNLKNMPDLLRPHSYLECVYFDGAVASVRPPESLKDGVIANEMEGELALAGLKEAAKHSCIDFRNPCVAIDMGTTLSGRISDESGPYAQTIANFCGYAGAVADALVLEIDDDKKSAYEFIPSENETFEKGLETELKNAKNEIMKSVSVMKIPADRKRFGPFHIQRTSDSENGLILFGCDVGEDGSDLKRISEIGKEIYEKGGKAAVSRLADEVMSDIAVLLIKCVRDEELLKEGTLIGITGRAGISGMKKELTFQKLKEQKILEEPEKRIIFAEDGLARGAAVMARCMNSLGCPKNPIGGRRGGKCIMKERHALQNKKQE